MEPTVMGSHLEVIRLRPNKFAPNNSKPILVYRNALAQPVTEQSAKALLESHGWDHKGTWGHISQRHFHPNTHECYGIFQGKTTLLVGCGHNDDISTGVKVELRTGDVIVLPAGTGHCNFESTDDLRYIGVYPADAEKWRNELGKSQERQRSLLDEANAVALPAQDPVAGPSGPLPVLWQRRLPPLAKL